MMKYACHWCNKLEGYKCVPLSTAVSIISSLQITGTKRFDSEKAGDREVQRTMLELLNQMDGFQPNSMIKVRF